MLIILIKMGFLIFFFFFFFVLKVFFIFIFFFFQLKQDFCDTQSEYDIKERKDSNCSVVSDVGLLCISGRTSRLSSIGSAASGASGASGNFHRFFAFYNHITLIATLLKKIFCFQFVKIFN